VNITRVNVFFFCQTGERAREREKRATGARSGHGHHSISMETLH